MVGIAEEYGSAIDLVVRAHKKLSGLDSDNDLLRFVEVTSGGFRFYPQHKEDYMARFAGDSSSREGQIVEMGKYSNAISDEISRLERAAR
jgi:hypothetical protein